MGLELPKASVLSYAPGQQDGEKHLGLLEMVLKRLLCVGS